jgi:hypothetical protein
MPLPLPSKYLITNILQLMLTSFVNYTTGKVIPVQAVEALRVARG